MKSRAILCFSTMLLFSCGPAETPQGVMQLLRTGDPRLCVDSQVEGAVRDLIKPSSKNFAEYGISFSDATLESFDGTVSKAVCNANLRIETPDGALDPTRLDYVIQPAAQKPDSLIVSASVFALRSQLREFEATKSENRELEAQIATDRNRLVAMVKPGWLLGRWVMGEAGASACRTGPFAEFGRKQRLTTENGSGAWTLDGFELKFVGADTAFGVTITAANPNRFTTSDERGTIESFRRCTRADLALADQYAPEPEELGGDYMMPGNDEMLQDPNTQ